jgi:hypothetical protein
MHPIPPYGVAVTQAIASGDLDTMRQVAEQAEAHLNQHGDIAQLLNLLKVEIAKAEAASP